MELPPFGKAGPDKLPRLQPGEETPAAIRALEARLRRSRVPAFACTADAMKQQVRGTAEAGFDGHISKPVRAEILEAALALIRRPSPRAVA